MNKQERSFVVYHGGKSTQRNEPPIVYYEDYEGTLKTREASRRDMRDHKEQRPFEEEFGKLNREIEVDKIKINTIIEEMKSFADYYHELHQEILSFFSDLEHIELTLWPWSSHNIFVYNRQGKDIHRIAATKKEVEQHAEEWISGYKMALHNLFLKKLSDFKTGLHLISQMDIQLRNEVYHIQLDIDKTELVGKQLSDRFFDYKLCVYKLLKLMNSLKKMGDTLLAQMFLLNNRILTFDLQKLPEARIDFEELNRLQKELQKLDVETPHI